MNEFKNLLMAAKMGDAEAKQEIVTMYQRLAIKQSLVDGVFDSDLNQQLYITILGCVKAFKI